MILDMAAQAANRVGRTDVAARIQELFDPLPEVMLVTGPQCSVHTLTTRGILASTLGHHDEADDCFRRASEILESFAPIPYARNLYEHGRALLELGDPADGEEARRLLTRAATSFERYGLDARVAQCEELLATDRVSGPAAGSSGCRRGGRRGWGRPDRTPPGSTPGRCGPGRPAGPARRGSWLGLALGGRGGLRALGGDPATGALLHASTVPASRASAVGFTRR